jgi:hypothetical protein
MFDEAEWSALGSGRFNSKIEPSGLFINARVGTRPGLDAVANRLYTVLAGNRKSIPWSSTQPD